MRRLFWVALGAAVAVAGARKLGLLDAPSADGRGSRPTPTQAAFRAAGTAAGAVRSLSDARRELRDGMAEREEQLRHDLVGDVDVDALRAERSARRATAAPPDTSGAVPPAWHRDPEAREATRAARARERWAGEPTDDPEDGDGDVPYSFS